MFGPKIQKQARSFAEKIIRPISHLGITPNMVSGIGMLLNVVAAIELAFGPLRIGGALILFAGVFDMFDGAMARVQQQTSLFGAFLDSTLDRYAEGAVLLGVIVHITLFEHAGSSALLLIILAYSAALLSLIVSYTRARAEGLGLDCKVGLMERPERVLLLGAGLLIGADSWLVWVLLVLAAATAFTGLQRIAHVYRQSVRKRPSGQ